MQNSLHISQSSPEKLPSQYLPDLYSYFLNNMELLNLIWLKMLEIVQSFWIKAVLSAIWWFLVYFFKLQDAAHTAVSVLFLLDGIIGIAHAVGRDVFDQKVMFTKFRVKFFAYAILILTGWALDLAIVKWAADFGFHYMACVFLSLTDWASISKHLEAFWIKVPFQEKINSLLKNMYGKK